MRHVQIRRQGVTRAPHAFMLLLALGGCVSMGPQRLGVDRSDYANRLRETNKEQLLLNIVAMRYGDAPLFLEVSSVIAQYTREGSVHADAQISPAPDDANGSVGGSILLRETPTVTYTPLAGDRFARSLMTPLSPASLLAMIESGWSAESLFLIAARSINGLDNGSLAPMFAHHADPDFEQVLAALGRLQREQGLALHVRHDDGKFTATAHFDAKLSKANEADIDFLVRRLNLPGRRGTELAITFGAVQTDAAQIAIGTRSMFEILAEMAQGVDIPAEARDHVVQSADGGGPALIHVLSGDKPPGGAHVAIRYRDRWFWIDGNDAASKRMFLIAQVLLSLNDTSGGASAPLVTIPTG